MVLQPMEAEDIPQGKYNMAKRINYSEVFLSFYITYYYCIVLAQASVQYVSHIIICVLLHPQFLIFISQLWRRLVPSPWLIWDILSDLLHAQVIIKSPVQKAAK